jgi:hypothetical protein
VALSVPIARGGSARGLLTCVASWGLPSLAAPPATIDDAAWEHLMADAMSNGLTGVLQAMADAGDLPITQRQRAALHDAHLRVTAHTVRLAAPRAQGVSRGATRVPAS